jgi:hypothetical protein
MVRSNLERITLPNAADHAGELTRWVINCLAGRWLARQLHPQQPTCSRGARSAALGQRQTWRMRFAIMKEAANLGNLSLFHVTGAGLIYQLGCAGRRP